MAKKIEGVALNDQFHDPITDEAYNEATRAGWASATLVIHDGPSERVYLESEVRAAAMAEPELPGNMPDEMWEACRSDRATMQEAMRVVVRLTRDGILQRISTTL